MSLQGPMVVVTEKEAAPLVDALRAAGAFPVVETPWSGLPAAFLAVQPTAIVLADPGPAASPKAVETLGRHTSTRTNPFIPMIGLARRDAAPALPDALPVDADGHTDRVVGRLRAAMRVRTFHATVLRRMEQARIDGKTMPEMAINDPADEATLLVTGRGPSYPELSTAIGERFGLIGALSIEMAARFLNSRDVNGLVIGDGFGPRAVEALLTVLAENARFHDLPVMLHRGPADLAASFTHSLPNLECLNGTPDECITWMMPMVRLHAFHARLRRMLTSLESEGVTDPNSGLLTTRAFWCDLERAVADSRKRGCALALARFSFGNSEDRRICIDTARLVAQVVRQVDFAWQDEDGSILCVFTDTDLRAAHLIARRIASVLKHTMLTADHEKRRIEVNVTLASLKSTDTLESLTRRTGALLPMAAEAV